MKISGESPITWGQFPLLPLQTALPAENEQAEGLYERLNMSIHQPWGGGGHLLDNTYSLPFVL